MLTHAMSIPQLAPILAVLVALGVGIDYALFIVSRYRDALSRLRPPEEAVVEALTPAGRAVLFAGCTVMISVLGMLLMGLSFLYGLAVGTSIAVLVAVTAALTLLPALLGFLGFNVDKLSVLPAGSKHRRAPELLARTVSEALGLPDEAGGNTPRALAEVLARSARKEAGAS